MRRASLSAALAVVVASVASPLVSSSEGASRNGSVRRSIIVDVDVSAFYAWPPFYDPEPALAVAYLLGDPEVEVLGVAAGFSQATKPWLLRMFSPHPCKAIERLLVEVGRPSVPILCASASSFLDDGKAVRSLAKLLGSDRAREGAVASGVDRGGFEKADSVTWISLDSTKSLISVIRKFADASNKVAEAAVLREALSRSEARSDSAADNDLAPELRGLPKSLKVKEAELALLFEQQLHVHDERGLPAVVLLPGGLVPFKFGSLEVSTIQAKCPNAWFSKHAGEVNRYVWLAGHMRKFPEIPKPFFYLIEYFRRYIVDPPVFQFIFSETGLGQSRHGFNPRAIVAAVASTPAGVRRRDLFKESCVVVPIETQATPPVPRQPRLCKPSERPHAGDSGGAGKPVELEVRTRALQEDVDFLAFVAEGFCRIGDASQHQEL